MPYVSFLVLNKEIIKGIDMIVRTTIATAITVIDHIANVSTWQEAYPCHKTVFIYSPAFITR